MQKSKMSWKKPTIVEIAKLAGVGTASVDRVLNNRKGVKEKTRKSVMDAIQKLQIEYSTAKKQINICLFCESGETFNEAMKQAVLAANKSYPGVVVSDFYVNTSELEPTTFAKLISEKGRDAAGVMVVAREHPYINNAIRKLIKANIPVVCLTTDLPSSRRTAYIGNDQYAAGCVAAQLVGQMLPDKPANILLIVSASFWSQQDREMGFRRVLRTEYPHLKLEERVISDETIEMTKEQVLAYFHLRGCPAAIYNVAGGNRGIADALSQFSNDAKTIFVGHELTETSRSLLEESILDYVISHDLEQEVRQAIEVIENKLSGINIDPSPSKILLHTKYNAR